MMNYRQIANLLKTHNIESWVCGGSARDLYLKRIPVNHNIAVVGSLQNIQNTLSQDVRVKILETDYYDIKLKIEYFGKEYFLHPLKSIKLVNTYFNYEYTNDLQADAQSRDFTINSLFYDPIKDSWEDFVGGMDDIKYRILQFSGNAETKILESRIRLLRAFTLKSILGNTWQHSPDVIRGIQRHYLKLYVLDPRLVRRELISLFLRSDSPGSIFKDMQTYEVLFGFFPELYTSIGIEQPNKAVGLTLFEHIINSLNAVKVHSDTHKTLILRLAALLHDIGKPYTRVISGDNLHFYNHENIGLNLSEQILRRWGLLDFSHEVGILIKYHLFSTDMRSTAAIRKFIEKVGKDHVENLLELRIADRLGTGRSDISLNKVYQLRDRVNEVLGTTNIGNVMLALDQQTITDIVSGKTDEVKDTVDYITQYLRHKVFSGTLPNKPKKLKEEIIQLFEISCPLGKKHLSKIWTELQTHTAQTFPDGKLTCGTFCNFLCNEKLKK